jgi:hypothetical protein
MWTADPIQETAVSFQPQVTIESRRVTERCTRSSQGTAEWKHHLLPKLRWMDFKISPGIVFAASLFYIFLSD